MSELTSTYTLLLSDATKEATYNRMAEVTVKPTEILAYANNTLVIGKRDKKGVYHFYPVLNPQTETESRASIGGAAQVNDSTMFWFLFIGVLIYRVFIYKSPTA
jgi:hypothetical protein